MKDNPNKWPLADICTDKNSNVVIIKYNQEDIPNIIPGCTIQFYFLKGDGAIDPNLCHRYPIHMVNHGIIRLTAHELPYIQRAEKIRLSTL